MTTHQLAYSRGGTLVDYGREVEGEIVRLQEAIEGVPELAKAYPLRWLAIKLLENDSDIIGRVKEAPQGELVLTQLDKVVAHLQSVYGDEVDTIIADRRYGFIHGLVKEAVKRPATDRIALSDRIDKVVTSRILGIPIFLIAMWFVFQMTANVSSHYVDWVDSMISGPLTHWLGALVGLIGLGGTWFESFLLDGIVAGVGGVVVFVPMLLFLYFFLALLEDSGYMARAAFVMDRLMHVLGLHGKSFLPMLVGFGCNVPGIYATRTLENREDRLLTGLLVPMMSCGARLPVYAVFAVAFFPSNPGRLIFALYLTGIAMAIVTGMVFKRVLFRGKPPAPFVMELPPYRWPSLRSVLIHMWERASLFVRRAGTIILAVSAVIWFLTNIPWGVEKPRDSLFGQVSAAIAPVFAPAGFGNWEATGALVTGFVAKEIVVGTMSQIYGGAGEEMQAEPPTFLQDLGEIAVGFGRATVDTVKETISLLPGVNLMDAEEEEQDTTLTTALHQAFTPLQAVAFCVFVLLYVPCITAVAAMRQEYGTRWMLFSAGYLLALAWVAATAVYQGGRLLGLG